jgi:Asp-tRNA(Asn)/Glu-tRNA(Gln) amidotransferase A subunit family amidase
MNNVLNRRRFIAWFTTTGVATLLAPRVLGQDDDGVAVDAIEKAEGLSGLTFTPEERELMRKSVKEHMDNFAKVREVPLPNDVAPALQFSPLLVGTTVDQTQIENVYSKVKTGRTPTNASEIAFYPVTHLAELLRKRRITAMGLTDLYIERLKEFDPKLRCVITLTEDLAREQASAADRDLRRGIHRGPLHGIPWGLKDLFATKGVRTTWGAMPFKDQMIDEDATVVKRLTEAGAILVAKLSVGALAWGDVWFDATTKNPWNLEQGSSGSSAGPASATVAGRVGFSIGTETLGSIISPSQRCGATGLRPTFGRVSRHGGMALSWSMDKVGPICRSVEDCALVLDAIRGSDGKDADVIDAPFNWDVTQDPRLLRVGYDAEAFEKDDSDDKEFNQAALDTLREMGFDLIPIKLPELPVGDMLYILEAEAAAAFDDLTRSNKDDQLVRQIDEAWPNVFRAARFIPAVEYIQANRVRTLLMRQFEEMMEYVDVYVHPTYGGKTLVATNLTGHPSVVLPNGFREDGTPTSITFTGKLFGEAELLLVAKAYQDETGFHERHPDFY